MNQTETLDNKVETLQLCIAQLPASSRAEAYLALAGIYKNFAHTLLLEQAARVTTGFAQATFGKDAIVKINIGLDNQYRTIGRHFEELAANICDER